MWPFGKATKNRLREHKTVWISGVKFVIRKINPLFDFAPDKMPQIFTDIYSQRQANRTAPLTIPEIRKYQDDMMNAVKAGLVVPVLGDGISVEDIFSNPDVGARLFQEVLIHSLNRFRGLKGVFFSIGIRRSILRIARQSLV
jgi:hypothetical protein